VNRSHSWSVQHTAPMRPWRTRTPRGLVLRALDAAIRLLARIAVWVDRTTMLQAKGDAVATYAAEMLVKRCQLLGVEAVAATAWRDAVMGWPVTGAVSYAKDDCFVAGRFNRLLPWLNPHAPRVAMPLRPSFYPDFNDHLSKEYTGNE
jgi:hypothetical protein